LPCNIFDVTTFTFHLKILFKKFSKQRAGYHLVYIMVKEQKSSCNDALLQPCKFSVPLPPPNSQAPLRSPTARVAAERPLGPAHVARGQKGDHHPPCHPLASPALTGIRVHISVKRKRPRSCCRGKEKTDRATTSSVAALLVRVPGPWGVLDLCMEAAASSWWTRDNRLDPLSGWMTTQGRQRGIPRPATATSSVRSWCMAGSVQEAPCACT
jgi:hypothetical protein